MAFSYIVKPLPELWPGGKPTPHYSRQRSRFKTRWNDLMNNLLRETSHLGATDIVLRVDCEFHHLRQDGQLRADARLKGPAVILEFVDRKKNLLQFPCDTFTFWEDNLRAIAGALEALRLVDRYGVKQGAHYVGFKAIPAKTSETMDTAAAAKVIWDVANDRTEFPDTVELVTDVNRARQAVRVARKRAHPDQGDGSALWPRVQQAADVLSAHFGEKL